MKIVVDKKNKAVIATGWYKSHKIRAVAVCHPEDTFDVDFGIELVTKKYKIKEKYVKMNIHESYMKSLDAECKWLKKEYDSEDKIINNLDIDIQNKIYECENFVKSKYNN